MRTDFTSALIPFLLVVTLLSGDIFAQSLPSKPTTILPTQKNAGGFTNTTPKDLIDETTTVGVTFEVAAGGVEEAFTTMRTETTTSGSTTSTQVTTTTSPTVVTQSGQQLSPKNNPPAVPADLNAVMLKYYLSSAPSKECGDLMIKADSCVRDALFMGVEEDGSEKRVSMPQTEEELNEYCGKVKSTLECVTSYRKCLKLFPKTLFNVLVRNLRATMKRICGSESEKKVALQHLHCFKYITPDFYFGVVNSFTGVILNISGPAEDPSTVIPKCCCAYNILSVKGEDMVKEICNSKTGLETGAYVIQLIKSVVSPLTDMVCGSHSTVQVCQNVMPYESKLYVRLQNESMMAPASQRFTFSPLTPIIKILNNLDQKINLRR